MATAVLILSGGQSRRMGQDKASLLLEGMPLLQWQQNRLQRAGFQVVQGVADNYPGFRGPLAGIEAALRAHPDVSRWLVLPVDMPSLPTETMQHLLRVVSAETAVACYHNQPFPLLIQQPQQVLSLLQQWLSDPNGRRSIRALIDHLGGECLAEPSDKEQFNNINTPEQWRQFKEVEYT